MTGNLFGGPPRLGDLIMAGIAPHRTEFRGAVMRSLLERQFAKHLDGMGVEWAYEPRKYGPPGAGYIPDFQLALPSGAAYVEVKPTLAEVPLARERMEVIWKTEPGVLLMVACAEGNTFFAAERPGGWVGFVDRWAHG